MDETVITTGTDLREKSDQRSKCSERAKSIFPCLALLLAPRMKRDSCVLRDQRSISLFLALFLHPRIKERQVIREASVLAREAHPRACGSSLLLAPRMQRREEGALDARCGKWLLGCGRRKVAPGMRAVESSSWDVGGGK
eukprot:1285765-Amphidinium_carterae.1